MWSQWTQKILCVAAVFFVAGNFTSKAEAQLRDVTNNRSLRITYDGHIYLRLPHMDVALSGLPTMPGYSEDQRARVIYRNNQGSFWDGNRFYLSPSYRYGLVTRNDRSQHYIGELQGQWPPVDEVRPGELRTAGRAGLVDARTALQPAGAPLALAPNRSPLPLPNLPPIPYPPKKVLPKAETQKEFVNESNNDAFLGPVPKKAK